MSIIEPLCILPILGEVWPRQGLRWVIEFGGEVSEWDCKRTGKIASDNTAGANKIMTKWSCKNQQILYMELKIIVSTMGSTSQQQHQKPLFYMVST